MSCPNGNLPGPQSKQRYYLQQNNPILVNRLT